MYEREVVRQTVSQVRDQCNLVFPACVFQKTSEKELFIREV
jgi:hypothetical protein